ncbi:hypothetical protein R3W88_004736 [Solanum pinnatisectum]|uniref:Major facilitator superfamily (MFS) profile domain-containing protein n=1 Tax=Solanum pinnatisectum TaxID=50273 RepID=A0AAV9KAM8_9SOLN|nr:hypothetical protein R3W88_004736 [Solanum pinnatisectum]
MEKGTAGENPTRINKYACACAIVASMISIIFGYDTGVMSGAMIFVKKEFKISDAKTEVPAGMLNLCALVGSLSAGRTSDYIGRRYTIVIASVIFLCGSVLMGYGPSYVVLLVGRCIAGVGVGFALMIAPVYSAEVSSPSTRGFLIGILLGYLSNYIFSGLPLRLGWRIMLGIAAIPSLFLAIGILRMPESPRWLIMKGSLGEAKEIMHKVSNDPEEAEFRLREIKKAIGIDENCDDDIVKIADSVKSQGEGVWKELLLKPTKSLRWILIAGIGIHFFEHATGIEAVILYSHKIFDKAGLTFILLSTLLIDRVGRRKLLLTNLSGMVVTLTRLGIFLTLAEHSGGELIWALVLSIITTYGVVMFFNIGLGPVTWVYTAEIFPLKFRGLGVGIVFLSISAAITTGGAFFMFAGISVIALIFFYVFLPETKGKSLEEMEAVFTRGTCSKDVSKEVEIGKF